MTTGAPFLVQASLCSCCCQNSTAPTLTNYLCCLLLQTWQVLLQPVGVCGDAHTHIASQLHDYWGSFSGSGISVQLLLSAADVPTGQTRQEGLQVIANRWCRQHLAIQHKTCLLAAQGRH